MALFCVMLADNPPVYPSLHVIVVKLKEYPQGIFLDNAISLVPQPPLSEKQMLDYFQITMEHALAYGLTSIHDAETLPQFIDFFKR